MAENTNSRSKSRRLPLRETIIFALLGALMFVSKLVTEPLPNIHLIGSFVVAFTAVYRKKALYPIYVFVFMSGLFYGFATWWLAYLYIWTILWGMVMLIPRRLRLEIKFALYITVCALHGFLYGVFYAPCQAILFGLNFEKMIAWIIAGLPFDLIHGFSNALCGVLIIPIVIILKELEKA